MLEVMMIAKVHVYLQVSRVVEATFVSVLERAGFSFKLKIRY